MGLGGFACPFLVKNGVNCQKSSFSGLCYEARLPGIFKATINVDLVRDREREEYE